MMFRSMRVLLTVTFLAGPTLADRVTLTTGDVLTGRITEQTDQFVRLAHPVLGELAIPAASVAEALTDAQIEAAAQAQAQAEAQAGADAADPPTAPAEPQGFFAGWESTLDVGLSGTSGNSENVSGFVTFASKKANDTDRWAYDATYRYAAEESESSTNKFTTGLVKDWLMPDSKWFIFADGRFDWDQFESWQTRVQAHVGPGYQFIDNDKWNIVGRAGLGAIREFGSDNDNIRPEGLAGVDATWNFAKDQKLVGSSYIYPDFNDLGEFRTVSKIEWSAKMAALNDASLKAGIKHEHESIVDPGDEKNDFWYFAGLSFGF